MTDNPLVRSVAIVFATWFLIFYLLSGQSLFYFPLSLGWSVVSSILGAAAGAGVALIYRLMTTDGVRFRLQAGDKRLGMKVSLGNLPGWRNAKRKSLPKDFFSRFRAWEAYERNCPRHAALMRAAGEVMVAADVPASPVPGGHGGASLVEHSWNVVEMMLQAAPRWQYTGHRNKKGEITFPLIDVTQSFHSFKANDPILPLAAFLHDIGKTVCYRKDGDRITEVKPNHDTEGAKLLRQIPELWDLPRKDIDALLIAVGYYHHPGGLPTSLWIDDRMRSLTELLAVVDIATGRREGEKQAGANLDLMEDPVGDVPWIAPPTAVDDQEETASGAPQAQHAQAAARSSSPAPAVATEFAGDDPIDLFLSVLLEPNRVNGSNAMSRIAFKHGKWLYVSDARLRSAVAKRTGDSSFETMPGRGQMHPWTLALMARLAEMEALKTEHDGREFSPKRAIFNTAARVEGHPDREEKFVLIASVEAFPSLARIPDCKSAPIVTGCSWGESAAINKKKGDDTEPELNKGSEPAPTNDLTSDVSGTDDHLPWQGGEAAAAAPILDSDLPFDAAPSPGSAVDMSSLMEELGRVARLEIEGPQFKERVVDGCRYAFFEMDEIMEKFNATEESLRGAFEVVKGGQSNKDFIRIPVEE